MPGPVEAILEFAVSPMVAGSALIYLQRKGIRCYKTNGDKTIVCKLSEGAQAKAGAIIQAMDKMFDATVSKIPGIKMKPAQSIGPTEAERALLNKGRDAIKKTVDTYGRAREAVHQVGDIAKVLPKAARGIPKMLRTQGPKAFIPRTKPQAALATVVVVGSAAAGYAAYKLLKSAGMAVYQVGNKVITHLRGPKDQQIVDDAARKVGGKVQHQMVEAPNAEAAAAFSFNGSMAFAAPPAMTSWLKAVGFNDAHIQEMTPKQAIAAMLKSKLGAKFKASELYHYLTSSDFAPSSKQVGAVHKVQALIERNPRAAKVAVFVGAAAIGYVATKAIMSAVMALGAKLRGNKLEVPPDKAKQAKALVELDQHANKAASFSIACGESKWSAQPHVQRVLAKVGSGEYEVVKTFRKGNQLHTHLRALTSYGEGKGRNITHVTDVASGKYTDLKGWTNPPSLKGTNMACGPTQSPRDLQLSKLVGKAVNVYTVDGRVLRGELNFSGGSFEIPGLRFQRNEIDRVERNDLHLAPPPNKRMSHDVACGLLSPITHPVDSAETTIGVAGITGTLMFMLAPQAARNASLAAAKIGVQAFQEGRRTILQPDNIAKAKAVVNMIKRLGGQLVKFTRH